MCRCQGYVYTYRLQKDVSGSWAADVRHFILLPFIVNLGFIRLKKNTAAAHVLFLIRQFLLL